MVAKCDPAIICGYKGHHLHSDVQDLPPIRESKPLSKELDGRFSRHNKGVMQDGTKFQI